MRNAAVTAWPGGGGEDGAVIEVAELVRYADNVEATAELITAEPGPLRQCRASLLQTTRELRDKAREPVRIAVAGHFSCGKSLLLGTLVGRPDLLAVGRTRATAVVTLLQIGQAEEGATESQAAWRIEFLSTADFEDLLGHLHGCLVEAAERTGAPQAAVAELRRLPVAQDGWTWSGEPGRMAELDAWCAAHAGADAANRLRRVGDEVRRLVAAWTRYRQYVGAPPLDVPPEAGRELSRHGDPAGGAPVLPPDALPLVDRVVIDVRVPARIWDLSAMTDENRLWLIDLPGMNADEATERDLYLCRRELRRADTLLALLDARTGATAILDELIAMLDERAGPDDPGRSAAVLPSRVLAVINRFDEIDHSASAFADLERADPLDLDRVLASFDVLASLDRLVRRTMPGGISGRVAVTSAVLGVAALTRDRRVSVDPKAAAELNLAAAVAGAQRQAAQWRLVTERLRAAAPAGAMESALHSFTEDGGLDWLRTMIAAHVQRNGMVQRQDAVLRIARRLRGEVERARQLLAAGGAEADPATRGRAEELRALTNRIAEHFEGLREDIRGRLQDSAQIVLADGRTMLEAIRQEAAFLVFSWPEWVPLIDSAKDGRVHVEEHHGVPSYLDDLDDEDEDDDEHAEAEVAAPRTTAELRGPYERTAAELDSFIGEMTDQVIDRWVAAQHERMEADRAELARLVPLAELADLPDRNVRRRYRYLHDMAGLRALDRAVEEGRKAPAADPVVQDFPLRANSSLPWDPDRPASAEEETDRHFVRLLRIRRELVEALVRRARQQVESHQARLVLEIRNYVSGWQRRYPVPTSSDADVLVRLLHGGTATGLGPAELADQLESIPVPHGLHGKDPR